MSLSRGFSVLFSGFLTPGAASGTLALAALALVLVPAPGVLAQEESASPTAPVELAAGEPVALPAAAPGDSAAAESGDVCEGYSAPFFRGSGGFVVEPEDGRSAELTVQFGDDSDTRTVYAGRNGQAVELLASDLCASGGSPAECQVTFGGIRGGGWYWVNGDRNAAVAPLVCSEDLGGGTAPLDPGGVQVAPSTYGTGTLFIHDTQGLMGIVPQLSPTGRAGSPSCERYVAPFFRGRGGFVARPASGRTAEVTVERGSSMTREPLSPRSDGLAVELLSDSLCTDADGQPVECKVSFTGIGEGGWYWVNGDRNAAVAPLVCEGGLSGTPALEPRGVAASRAAFGTGSLFVHDTQRLMGIVPHLSGPAEDDRTVEVRISVFGGGTVDVVGDGELECVGTATCVGYFDAAGSVTLRASAPAGYDFDRWQGCDTVSERDCTVALHEDRLVFLSFRRPLTLRDHVVQFDRNRLEDIRQYDPSSGLMVLAADAKVDDIEIGSVLVSSVVEPDLAFESTFLRLVTDMQEFAGSSTYVKTTHATLEDLIESGTLAVGLPVGSEAMSASALLPQILPTSPPAADLAVRDVSRASSSFECPTEAVEGEEDDLTLKDCMDEPIEDFTTPSGIKVTEGHLGFGFAVGLSLDLQGASLTEARAMGNVKGHVKGSVEATRPITTKRFKSPYPLPPLATVQACKYLFALCGDLTLAAEPFFEVDVEAGTALSGSWDVSATGGIQWATGSGWSFPSSRPKITARPLIGDSRLFEGEAIVRAGLDFTASAGVTPTVFRVTRASAGLSAEPYLETKLFEVTSGSSCTWNYKLSANVKAEFVLDLTAFFTTSVGHKSFPFWTGSHDLDFGRDCGDENLTAPQPPAALRFGSITATTIEVEWDASPKTAEGYDVDYEVLRSWDLQRGTQYHKSTTFAAAEARYRDTGLLPETNYCYRVRTVVAGVAKSDTLSGELCGWTDSLDTTPPSAPVNLVAEALSSGAISLTWDGSVDDRELGHYVVLHVPAATDQAGRPAAPYGIGTSETPAFTATGLNAGTEYCFSVRAVDAAGNAADSVGTACATTFPHSEASWRFRIGCTSEAYRYEGAVDLRGANENVVVWGEGTDYDGERSLSWALSGPYDATKRVLEGEVSWLSDDLDRKDSFTAELSSGVDDTGDIAMSVGGRNADCTAVVRFNRPGTGSDDDGGGDGTSRVFDPLPPARIVDLPHGGLNGVLAVGGGGTGEFFLLDEEADKVVSVSSTAFEARARTWNLSWVSSASGRCSATPLMKAADMSIVARAIEFGSPPCATRCSANSPIASDLRPSARKTRRRRSVSATAVT